MMANKNQGSKEEKKTRERKEDERNKEESAAIKISSHFTFSDLTHLVSSVQLFYFIFP